VDELPALQEIRRIVEDELLEGHSLDTVELTVDTPAPGLPPMFTVLISVIENEDADEARGVGYEVTRRIRKLWARDDLFIKINWKPSDAQGQ
jgi:hypothetical protein